MSNASSCYYNHPTFFCLCLCIILSRVFSTRVVESTDLEKFLLHSYIKSSLRPSQDSELVTIFAIKQRNLDKLEELLYDVSNASSDKYGQHLTRSEVADLTSNPSSTKAVLDYLSSQEITVLSQTIYGEYITVKATLGVWESMLDTKFSTYKSKGNDKKKIIRASRYHIPIDIDHHVTAIFNVLDFPAPSKLVNIMPMPKGSETSTSIGTYPGYITPTVLNSYYNIFYNKGNSLASQSVFSGVGQYFSSADLNKFLAYFGITKSVTLNDANSRNNATSCHINFKDCAESNLDLQYLMAIAQNINTTIVYETNFQSSGFLDWITTTANMVNPPLVHSISYVADEGAWYQSVADSFNTEAMKLGIMGVTIIAASGDNGVAGLTGKAGLCGYYPSFPATSPYVTAVGATKGAEVGGPEVVCQADVDGVITSGGGFSILSPAPAFQSTAISHYFSTVGTNPVSGYSSTGRGIPDVSLAGYKYLANIDGSGYFLSGTSASTPVFAGMVSLVNAARLLAGMPSLGWLNPAIYASGGSFTNDITSGNNQCTEEICCTEGFYAAPGWDPVTGFGSVDFTRFYKHFMSAKPTVQPANAPATSGSGAEKRGKEAKGHPASDKTKKAKSKDSNSAKRPKE